MLERGREHERLERGAGLAVRLRCEVELRGGVVAEVVAPADIRGDGAGFGFDGDERSVGVGIRVGENAGDGHLGGTLLAGSNVVWMRNPPW